MRKTKSIRRSAASHALTVAQLSPGIASKRLAKLSCATPMQGAAMLANFTLEKALVFAQAYTRSLVAMVSAQVSWWHSAATSGGPPHSCIEATSALLRSGDEIARTSLAPLARRVRLNAQ